MRVVLDTNVLIAALIARGMCSDLLEHCVLRHTLVTSDAILGELHAQLVGKFKYTVLEADEAVSLLRSQMEVVEPARLDRPICRDPDDDQILATGMAGRVQCIVTGDKDLLILGRHSGIEIVNPSGFTDFEANLAYARACRLTLVALCIYSQTFKNPVRCYVAGRMFGAFWSSHHVSPVNSLPHVGGLCRVAAGSWADRLLRRTAAGWSRR